ncbi:MAG: glycoside hydrolase family 38 C-terminal domain-containing protein [Armatimonadota bacterium]
MADKYTAHVVSHTHWDREWYKTFQHYRMRLVDLTDTLIELLETNPDFRYFTFDGQTIVLEDYLAIRPENEERLRKFIREGRIMIGPWYNQPDEFLVSGESMVRNFMLGRKLCDDFGNYLAVGYVPDCFGHISQFPQILRGFGIDSAVLFRGITADQVNSEFLWQSPDGSEVLAVKMPDNNAYSNWFYSLQEQLRYPEKPVDHDEATKGVQTLISDCIEERPTTSQLLFMDGCDHVFPQFKTPEIIKTANERIANIEVKHSTLPAFVAAVRSENPKLETIVGELRWSNRKWKLQALLTNVLSSRIHLKQMNHSCETTLEKYIEPLATWAWTLGSRYPKAYIDLAWKYLLKNSPHDSICGCSIDQVHRDMGYRYDQCREISSKLLENALKDLSGRVGSTADNPEKTAVLPVFNTLSHNRNEVIETEFDAPAHWRVPGVKVTDPEGKEMPHALLGMRIYQPMDPEPYDIPCAPSLKKVKIAFPVENVPGVGYKAYRIEVLDTPNRQPRSMLLGPDTAENEYLSLTVSSDGTFSLLDKETDSVFTNCLIFEDCGDFGDGWNYVKPFKDKAVTSLGAKTRVSVAEDNAVRVVFEIISDLELPKERHANGLERSEETVICRIKTYLTIAAGSKRLDIKTAFVNYAKDHRLRVLFPSGIPADVSHAEQPFDVVERKIAVQPCPDWKEPMPAVHPQKSFVDISGGGIGLTLINKALQEYEVRDDEARTIALTLMRAFGNGVRAPEHQQEGQMIGEYTFEYALYPHAGDWEEAGSYIQAHNFNVPMITGQTDVHEGELPMQASFMKVSDPAFVLTALKKAEREEAIVLRGFNIAKKLISLGIKAAGASKAEKTNLNEEPLEPMKAVDGKMQVSVKPKEIVTVKVE